MPASAVTLCTTMTASRSTRLVPAESSASCRVANSAASVLALQLLAEVGLGPGFQSSVLHDELAESEDGLAVEPALLGQAREGRAGESSKLLQVLEIFLLDGDLLLKPLSVGLEFLEQLLLGSNLLPRVVLDGTGSKPGAENSQAVGPFGVERAVDRLRGQRGDDQLDGPIPPGNAHLAGHERLPLVDRDVGDLALRGPRRRRSVSLAAAFLDVVRGSRFCGPGSLRRPARPPSRERRSWFVLDGLWERMGRDS